MQTDQLTEPQRRILDAAKTVFGAHGYRGGSLNEVAKRAGYTRAGVLHHFPSKEAMLLALLDLRDERLHVLEDADGDEGFFDLLDRVPDALTEILADRALIQLAHALTAEASHPDHPARAWASERHARLRERSVAAARRSIERGELRPDTDVEALAALLLGCVEGLEAQWLLNPGVDPRRGMELLVTLIRRGAST